MKKIPLKFNSETLIHLLGVQLYDSPMAMLRENVQNAFDAIKERQAKDAFFANPEVSIQIDHDTVVIKDNGIGMDQSNLENNYWTAGNSGKNTRDAQAAGVVGHFGIGALANFGVCTRLEVNTHKLGTNKRFVSVAEKEHLDGDNISIEEHLDESNDYGTTITVTLDDNSRFAIGPAKQYLLNFIKYVDVPILLNGENLSQTPIGIQNQQPNDAFEEGVYSDDTISFKYKYVFHKYMPMEPQLHIKNVLMYGVNYNGEFYLTKRSGVNQVIMGLHNGFGLSNMNLASSFGFSGFANFDFLQPTAGREAVSRQCVSTIQSMLFLIERHWASVICNYSFSDDYREFLYYVKSNFSQALAKNINILCDNIGKDKLPLSEVSTLKDCMYYKGQDRQKIESFKTSGKPLLRISPESPRRQIQLLYLQQIGIQEKDDRVEIQHIFSNKEIDYSEYIILAEIKKVIEDDYILSNFDIRLATITHEVQSMVMVEDGMDFIIYVSRSNEELKNIKDIYSSNYVMFSPMVKDFVRLFLYRQFSDYIPKGKKERAAYIDAAYQKRKEEFTITDRDVEDLKEIYEQFTNHKMSSSEFLDRIKNAKRLTQAQTLSPQQVGNVETVVRTASLEPKQADANNDNNEYIPLPPIIEMANATEKKILKTDTATPVLNNHKMFISLSNNMNRDYRSFFMLPHYTKVIWSTHRIIFIFTDGLGKLSLYYEMELTKKLDDYAIGGHPLISTTIITKKNIFVPIPEEIQDYFNMRDNESLKFFVHYDKANG